MKQIDLGAGTVATSPDELATVIISATDSQVEEKAIRSADARDDFLISTDALNFWRMSWRCSVEWGTETLDQGVASVVKGAICAARDYETDDFDSALQATRGRVRLPFGWTALDLAWKRSQNEPIRLLDPNLAGKRLPTAIAGIARHLQSLRGTEPIMLPINQLRAILEQRKIVVSGAVQRLLEARLLDYADETYYTGKAREFRFVGIEGTHFERDETTRTPKKERTAMSYQCPVCKFRSARKAEHPDGDRRVIYCPRCCGDCGKGFEIGGSPCHTLEEQSQAMPMLSGALRDKFERGETSPCIGQQFGAELTDAAPKTAEGKAKQLLEVIARRAPNPGDDDVLLTHETDYPLAYAMGPDGLTSFLAELDRRGWIAIKDSDESRTRCTMTVSGMKEIELAAKSEVGHA